MVFLYFNIGTYLRSRQYAFCDFEKKACCCIMESSDNDIFYSYSIIYDFCCIFCVLYAFYRKEFVIFVLLFSKRS